MNIKVRVIEASIEWVTDWNRNRKC